jgi:hypothetical protein
LLLRAQGNLQLLGYLFARFAIEELALRLAVHMAQAHRSTPFPIIPLVD